MTRSESARIDSLTRVRFDPRDEVTSTIADCPSGADEAWPSALYPPGLKSSDRQIEKIGGLRFIQERIGISSIRCGSHVYSPASGTMPDNLTRLVGRK